MTRQDELPRFVRDLLASAPRRGAGLNLWLYRVARVLHPYRTPAEIRETLGAATAGEPLQPGEIERAVERSAAAAWSPGQGARWTRQATAWPRVDTERRAAITTAGYGLVDLWEVSPRRLDDNLCHTEEVIDALFPGDPLLCAGRSKSDFDTRPREQWRGELSGMQLIVPSPMMARTGRTQEGKESAHTLEQTGPRRFLVIEQDRGTPDEQAAVLLHLAERAPLALAVHSGGKSIHGWFASVGQPEEKLRRFMRYAVSLGGDEALWTRSQFARMPDGTRDNDKRQTVYFFNPEVIQ